MQNATKHTTPTAMSRATAMLKDLAVATMAAACWTPQQCASVGGVHNCWWRLSSHSTCTKGKGASNRCLSKCAERHIPARTAARPPSTADLAAKRHPPQAGHETCSTGKSRPAASWVGSSAGRQRIRPSREARSAGGQEQAPAVRNASFMPSRGPPSKPAGAGVCFEKAPERQRHTRDPAHAVARSVILAF
jgi:hypothetical protein